MKKSNKELEKTYTLNEIYEELSSVNNNIEENLNSVEYGFSKGVVAQNILKSLRTLTEFLMCSIYMHENRIKKFISIFKLINESIEELKNIDKYQFLIQFHEELQIVSSHYMPSPDNCERLLLKYIDVLYEIHNFSKNSDNILLLNNLQKLQAFNDESKSNYYKLIADSVIKVRKAERRKFIQGEKYYIWSIKPFLWNNHRFYEVTYTLANDYLNKFDKMIAFTDLQIFSNYAVQLNFRKAKITFNSNEMNIRVITGWKTSIRNCEYQNFYKMIFGEELSRNNRISQKENNIINSYLTTNMSSLSTLVRSSDDNFNKVLQVFNSELDKTKPVFVKCLQRVRKIIKNNEIGSNTILYLLFHMNNKIIKLQTNVNDNEHFSNCYISKSCFPFEKFPFTDSLKNHNPKLRDIIYSGIPVNEHEDELFAKKIKNNTENKHQLFVSTKELGSIDYTTLIDKYNSRLWSKTLNDRKLVCYKNKIFINGYVTNIQKIYKIILNLSNSGIINFKLSMKKWLPELEKSVKNIDDEKKDILLNLFDKSKVAFIYGPAGTGKTTLIKYFSEYLNSQGLSKIFLAQTNTALDNLRKNVNGSNSRFYTVSHFVKYDIPRTKADILIIDECSTICNKDILRILDSANFQAILLVGDTFQIPSIKFGNWFSLCEKIMDKNVYHLTNIYRTSDEILQKLWEEVRNVDFNNKIEEFLVAHKVSRQLDNTIFEGSSNDFIILCLNYDGLYGINNINEYLQSINPNKAFTFKSHIYKINDPVLFNESNRFYPAIYNNMKGKIRNITIEDMNTIIFDIEVDTIISGFNSYGQTFQLIGNSKSGNSIIRFKVKKDSGDNDLINNKEYIMPFNVTYAMSINKAQGLEFNEVRLIVDGNRDESLNLNTFYTAITRAKKKLNIFWTPETENSFLRKIEDRKKDKNLYFLINCFIKNIN